MIMYAEKRFEERLPTTSEPKFGTLAHLIAWLETKPADKAYNFCCPHNCMNQQYYAAHFPQYSVIATSSHINIFSKPFGAICIRTIELPKHFNDIAFPGGPQTWTFGQALKRARAVAKDEKVRCRHDQKMGLALSRV
jgi:hypothetical protein